MIPHRTPFFLPLVFPSLIWRIPTNKKEVYLTFDDGPVNGPTEFVLSELEKISASATFFCIGDNIRKHEDVFKKIILAGHTIGNHTYNHLNGWKTKTEAYLQNIKLFEQYLPTAPHRYRDPLPALFRPPYGRITPSQIRALSPSYKIVMWDVLSRDFDKDLSPEDCLKNTLKVIRPGSIIVFHDSLKSEKNLVYTLPRLLSNLCDQGYAFKALES